MENQGHWVNNFWGADDAGYHQLMQRMQNSKQTMDELKQFYRERLLIEQEYTRKLKNLTQRALGSSETGEIKKSLETVRGMTKASAATHETVSRQLQEQLIATLEVFASSLRHRGKTVEDTMNQLTRAKSSQNTNSEKARVKYMEECNKISGFKAQQNLLVGKELEKNNQKLDKACMQVESFQRQYQDSLRALAQTSEIWNSEWRVSCDKLEQIEEERITFMKSSLWAFANVISAACVSDDEGCESIRLALERCDPRQDLREFSSKFGTGSKIQDPPEFVNFLQGFSRDDPSKGGHIQSIISENPLDETKIPNLGIPESPGMAYSPQSQYSPSNFTPMSSPGTTQMVEEYQYLKPAIETGKTQNMPFNIPASPQKKPWTLPFKRKSSPTESEFMFKPISAFDKPNPTPDLANMPAKDQSLAHNNHIYQSKPPNTQNNANRRSWAQASPKFSSGDPKLSPGTEINRNYNNNDNEDPLLTALEKLKLPASKPRPKSMGFTSGGLATNNSGNEATVSPYGNGHISPMTPKSSPPLPNFRKSPIHRKQVGSDSLPATTSNGHRVIRHCQAKYDYRAAIAEEVSFNKGDMLLITEMQEDGWWVCEVHNRGQFGLAPSNFLKTL